MPKIVELEQGTSDWLAFRNERITATDASIIMGRNPYKTPLTLWRQKLGLQEKDFVNEAMLRGARLEPKARAAFNEYIDLDLQPAVLVHDSIDWMMASLDGFDGEHIVEIKCPGQKVYDACRNGDIPDYWIIQMYHQMIVANLSWAYLFVFDGEEGILKEIEIDDVIAQEMLNREADFYRRMQEFDPPEDRYVLRKDMEWIRQADRTARAKMEYEKAKKYFEEERDKLVKLAGDANVEGAGVKVYHSYTKGPINYKSIPALEGVDLEKFRAKGSERVTVKFGVP
jgi:putative phage-type endonuclease